MREPARQSRGQDVVREPVLEELAEDRAVRHLQPCVVERESMLPVLELLQEADTGLTDMDRERLHAARTSLSARATRAEIEGRSVSSRPQRTRKKGAKNAPRMT